MGDACTEKRDCLQDLGTDGRLALQEILEKQDRHGLESSGSGERQGAGSCQHSKEPSLSINMQETSCLVDMLLASPVGLCSMESVSYEM